MPSIKKVIFVTTLVLLLVSVGMQSWSAYKLSQKEKFKWNPQAADTLANKDKATDARGFYDDYLLFLLGAPVSNLLALGLMGVVLVMGSLMATIVLSAVCFAFMSYALYMDVTSQTGEAMLKSHAVVYWLTVSLHVVSVVLGSVAFYKT